ncbi:MAG: hypothetical protein MJ252_23320 [archaeon]|nr:hypothetical protein [archaeon]
MFAGNFDLDKIFQVSLSYNFDALKQILESLMKKQLESERKIESLTTLINSQSKLEDKVIK